MNYPLKSENQKVNQLIITSLLTNKELEQNLMISLIYGCILDSTMKIKDKTQMSYLWKEKLKKRKWELLKKSYKKWSSWLKIN